MAVYMEDIQKLLIEIALKYENEISRSQLEALHWAVGKADYL